MADATERLLVRIDATTEQLRRELKKADSSITKTQKAVDKSLGKIQQSFDNLRKNITGKFAAAFSVAGIGLFTKQIVEASNTMAGLRGRLALVTESQEELNSVYEKSLKLANTTRQSTEATVGLYAKLATSTKQLGLSQNELLGITETINKTFVISGTTAEAASRTILQFGQALDGGTLRAEEFNSLIENSPRLVQALADGLEVTRGELRQMVVDGEVSSQDMITALQKVADTVDRDFTKIPPTIGGAFQALANNVNDALGKVDATPLIESMKELQEVLASEGFKTALANISAGLLKIVSTGAKALAAIGGIGEAVARAFGGPTDDIEELEKELAKTERRLDSLRGVTARSSQAAQDLRDKIADLNKRIAFQKELQEAQTAQQEKSNKAASQYAKLSEVIVKAKKLENKELNKLLKAYEKELQSREDAKKAIKDYIDDLEFEVKIMRESSTEQEIQTAIRRNAADATDEQKKKIRELITAREDERAAQREAAKQLEETTKKAKEEISAWDKALQDMAARIDSSFADAWKGAFDSFKSFSDSLKDAFKQMIAELLHQLTTARFGKALFGAFGIGGSSAAMASGGIGLSGIGSVLSGGLGNIITGAGSFATNTLGMPGLGSAIIGSQSGFAQTGALLGGGFGTGALISGGAGILGGYLGSQLYGPTSGIGSALGGVAGGIGGASLAALGAFGGPLGALVGAVGGGFIESLFGGKNNGNNSGKAILDLATGGINAFGVGKTFDQANVDAATQLAAAAQQLSAAFLNGEKIGDAGDALSAVLEDLLEKTDKLTPGIKKLIKAFDGTLEETVRFTMAIGTIADTMTRNGAIEAIEDFNQQLDLAGMTTRQVYNEQTSAISKMVEAFDGSLESTEALATAMSINKGLAYDLAMALQVVNKQIQGLVSDQINYFKRQTFTPDELIKDLEKSFNFLWAGLGSQTDPEKIRQIGEALLQINRELFDLGSPELQQLNSDFFIDRAKAIEEAVSGAVLTASVDLAATQEDMNAKVQAMLTASAGQFQQSANTMQTAAQIFMEAVMYFGGRNDQQYSEVTA